MPSRLREHAVSSVFVRRRLLAGSAARRTGAGPPRRPNPLGREGPQPSASSTHRGGRLPLICPRASPSGESSSFWVATRSLGPASGEMSTSIETVPPSPIRTAATRFSTLHLYALIPTVSKGSASRYPGRGLTCWFGAGSMTVLPEEFTERLARVMKLVRTQRTLRAGVGARRLPSRSGRCGAGRGGAGRLTRGGRRRPRAVSGGPATPGVAPAAILSPPCLPSTPDAVPAGSRTGGSASG